MGAMDPWGGSVEQIGTANPYRSQQVHTHAALVIITIRARASLGAQPHKGAHGQYGRGMTTEADSFPDGTPVPSGSRSARRARSPCHLTVPGSCSCARPPARTGRTPCGCSPRRTARSAWRPTRAPSWAAPRSTSPRGAGSPRTHPRGRCGDRRLRHRQRGRAGVFRLVRAAFQHGPDVRRGTRTPGPGTGDRPRPSPDGQHIAYVTGGALRVVGPTARATGRSPSRSRNKSPTVWPSSSRPRR